VDPTKNNSNIKIGNNDELRENGNRNEDKANSANILWMRSRRHKKLEDKVDKLIEDTPNTLGEKIDKLIEDSQRWWQDLIRGINDKNKASRTTNHCRERIDRKTERLDELMV